jgi:hypothetical protein
MAGQPVEQTPIPLECRILAPPHADLLEALTTFTGA